MAASITFASASAADTATERLAARAARKARAKTPSKGPAKASESPAKASAATQAAAPQADEPMSAWASMFAEHQPAEGWKLSIASTVTAILVGIGLGAVGETLSAVVAAGVLTLTGSVFLGLATYVLGFVLTMLAATYAGSAVGRYVLERRIGDDAAALRDGAKSLWAKARAKFTKTEGEGDITLH